MEDNIKMDLKEMRWNCCKQYLSNSRWGPVAGYFEHSD
jgi:hypothetical protein